jgi:hypothetical protein
MTGLGTVVRGYVREDIAPKPAAVTFGTGAPLSEATIIIGDSGGDKAFPYWLFASTSATVESDVTYKEYKRETQTKRVENPNDKEQFVDVEQINKIYLKNKADPKDKRSYELDNPKK